MALEYLAQNTEIWNSLIINNNWDFLITLSYDDRHHEVFYMHARYK